MSSSTPIWGLSPAFICVGCQQIALAEHANNNGSFSLWTMSWTYCPHNRRSVILKGLPGRPDEYMVSQPADEAELKRDYELYQSELVQVYDEVLAAAELRGGEGDTPH